MHVVITWTQLSCAFSRLGKVSPENLIWLRNISHTSLILTLPICRYRVSCVHRGCSFIILLQDYNLHWPICIYSWFNVSLCFFKFFSSILAILLVDMYVIWVPMNEYTINFLFQLKDICTFRVLKNGFTISLYYNLCIYLFQTHTDRFTTDLPFLNSLYECFENLMHVGSSLSISVGMYARNLLFCIVLSLLAFIVS